MNKIFCDRFKKLRQERDMTQSQIAKALGWIQTKVSKLELGQLEPDTDTLIQLSFFFDITVDYLIGVIDDMFVSYKKRKEPTELAMTIDR